MHAIRPVGSIYVADTAVIVGDVTFGEECSVWHHCVVRGDVAPIRIGRRVNIQDGAILHCKHDVALDVGDDVGIGHRATVHCRSVGCATLIGIHAAVLDDCEIGNDCIIAAGAVVPPGTIVPDGSVVMGTPGRVVRTIGDDDRDYVRHVIATYLDLARQHAEGRFKLFSV